MQFSVPSQIRNLVSDRLVPAAGAAKAWSSWRTRAPTSRRATESPRPHPPVRRRQDRPDDLGRANSIGSANYQINAGSLGRRHSHSLCPHCRRSCSFTRYRSVAGAAQCVYMLPASASAAMTSHDGLLHRVAHQVAAKREDQAQKDCGRYTSGTIPRGYLRGWCRGYGCVLSRLQGAHIRAAPTRRPSGCIP